jgi:hypothetical protein
MVQTAIQVRSGQYGRKKSGFGDLRNCLGVISMVYCACDGVARWWRRSLGGTLRSMTHAGNPLLI